MTKKSFKIGAVIVARMTSSRLPGKVLMPVQGRSLLEWLIRRIKKSKLISEIVVATTVNAADSPIQKLANKLKVRCFRGSEDDVLSRVLGAAESAGLDIVVHITGDCPLTDYRIIDKSVEFFLDKDVDYVKNFQWGKDAKPHLSFPNGLDVEVFYTKSLKKLEKLTNDPWLRQHVTEPFYTWPDFSFDTLSANKEQGGSNIRICLDTQEDLLVIEKIFKHFSGRIDCFSSEEIVAFLKNNHKIRSINRDVKQKKYSAAVIGLGNIGSCYDQLKSNSMVSSHSGAYMRWSKTHLVAGCDPDKNKQKKFSRAWGVKDVFFSPEEMLQKFHPDVVSICTPVGAHIELVKLCVKSGVKAILCEKPFVNNVIEGKKVVDLCRKRGVILAVNHWMRYSRIYRELKDKLDKGIIGNIFLIRYHYSKGLYNSGSHAIDLLRFLLGDVDRVMGVDGQKLDTGDDNISGVLRFKRGTIVHLTAGNYKHHFTTEIDIMGEKGRIRLADDDRVVEFYKSRRLAYDKDVKGLIKQPVLPFSAERGEFMVEAVSNLINALEGKEKVLCSGNDALEAIRVLDKLSLSFRKNATWEKV
jgi:spore coat polysaccharide biosynthesis protein SpsF (cytidylyltransferase family)/predicted dehydrogenase